MLFRTRFTKIFFALLLAVSLIVISIAIESEAAQNIDMKIGVADGVTSGKVMGEGLVFTDAKGRSGNVRSGAVIKASGAGISVGNTVLTMPVTAIAKSGMGWEGVRYRGKLVFIRAASGFTVVNEIDLENYLRGVLSVEMPMDWPPEALKAQAILARTYAIKNRGGYSKRGYDLAAGESSQMYRGINAEDPRADRAVSQTAGMVLTWNGQTADVFYHSDSGGATADLAHVWGGSRPYLQVRSEAVNYTSPNSTWQVVLSPSQITSILSRMKHNVGNVQSIAVALVDNAGRAVQLTFTGDRGAVNVKAHDFRMAAGPRVIKSTNLQITRSGGTRPVRSRQPNVPQAQQIPSAAEKQPVSPPEINQLRGDIIEMTRLGIFTSKELLDMLSNPEKREEYVAIGLERLRERVEVPASITPEPTRAPNPIPPTVPQQTGSGDFVFTGRGWGHGVGLSQWGAKTMAEQGMKYEEILAHYFPGTKIGK